MAEAVLQDEKKEWDPSTSSDNTHKFIRDFDMLKLVHELEVHHIELQMQLEELRLSAEKLAALVEKYTELYDFAPVGYFTVDENGIIDELNLTAAALLRKERSQLQNKNLLLFISEESRPLLTKFLRNLFKNPGKGNCEVLLALNDNEALFTHIEGVYNTATDTYSLVMIDISERRKAEDDLRKLSLIATKTVNAVVISNARQRIEWVNEAFTHITGFESEEALGRKIFELLTGPDTDPATVQYITNQFREQQPFECEIMSYSKSGRPFCVELKGNPLFNTSGQLTHYFNIGTDITERKNIFQKLVKSENQVRSFAKQQNTVLEDERARLAREIHDEFGQQLAGIKMSLSSLLYTDNTDNKSAEMVKTIMEKIDESMQSLRKFATELRPGILDTLGLIPSVEWLCKEFEKKSNISCQFHINVDAHPFDKETSISLFRICQEALTNILKHSAASEVSIIIKKIENELLFTITDNGKGMEGDTLENPFSMGILGMRERANLIGACLVITSEHNAGTSIHLSVKLK
jgi:PAS domain S-box-containing protein